MLIRTFKTLVKQSLLNLGCGTASCSDVIRSCQTHSDWCQIVIKTHGRSLCCHSRVECLQPRSTIHDVSCGVLLQRDRNTQKRTNKLFDSCKRADQTVWNGLTSLRLVKQGFMEGSRFSASPWRNNNKWKVMEGAVSSCVLPLVLTPRIPQIELF